MNTNEETNKSKAEEIRNKNLKPANPNIREHLGSEKIKDNIFGGVNSHKDNIVPYEKNIKKYGTDKEGDKIAQVADIDPDLINKAIKEEVKRSGADEALADYPPEIPVKDEVIFTPIIHDGDLSEEFIDEEKKKNSSREKFSSGKGVKDGDGGSIEPRDIK